MSGALALRTGILTGGNSSPVALGNGFVYSAGAGTRTAAVRLNSDGNLYVGDQGVFSLARAWRFSGASSDYDVFATINSGTVTGTTGSWVNLGTTRDWSVTDTTLNGVDVSAQITLQIRSASTLVVLASGVWDLTADRQS